MKVEDVLARTTVIYATGGSLCAYDGRVGEWRMSLCVRRMFLQVETAFTNTMTVYKNSGCPMIARWPHMKEIDVQMSALAASGHQQTPDA